MIDKIADAISQLRRMAMKKNRGLFPNLGHQARTDAVRESIYKNNNHLVSEYPVGTKQKPGTVFRGESEKGRGLSYTMNRDRGVKFQETKKRFWTTDPHFAIAYGDNGPKSRVLVGKVPLNKRVYPKESADPKVQRITDGRKVVNKFIEDAKGDKSRALKMLDKSEASRQYRDAERTVSSLEEAKGGVTAKRLQDWKNKHLNNSSFATDLSQPTELTRLKNAKSEVAKKHILSDDRKMWRTNSGNTIGTQGLRKTDMFRPSN